MAFQRDGAQVDARVDYFLFRGGRPPVLTIVEGESSQDAIVAAANRRRPTCLEVLAEWQPLVVGPTGIRFDIGHRDGDAQVRGAAARAGHRADRSALNGGAICLGQAWAGKWMEKTVAVQPQNRTGDVRNELLDFDAQSIGCRLQRLAFGNHCQNGVLKLEHAKAFSGNYPERACRVTLQQ